MRQEGGSGPFGSVDEVEQSQWYACVVSSPCAHPMK
jgi:hypothetical protein